MSLEPWQLENKNFTLPNFNEAGFNYRMTDIGASMALNHFDYIGDISAKRRKLASHYSRIIDEKKLDLIYQKDSNKTKSNYQSFAVCLSKPKLRDKVINFLRNKNIGCTLGTYSFSQLPLFEGECPNGKYFYENSISLPMFFDLTFDEIEFVCDSLQRGNKKIQIRIHPVNLLDVTK